MFFYKFSVCGNYGYLQSQCRVLGSTQKVELIFSFIFNKIEHIRYNSTDQKIVGYTEFGKKSLENYKNSTFVLVQAEFGIYNCEKIAKALIFDGMLNFMTGGRSIHFFTSSYSFIAIRILFID